MRLTRIDLPAGRSPAYRAAVADAVLQALGRPLDERFHVVAEHPGGHVAGSGYLGLQRSADALVAQVALSRGRNDEKKRRRDKILADALHDAVGQQGEDVIVSLVEIGREDWSFGDGEAQLA